MIMGFLGLFTVSAQSWPEPYEGYYLYLGNNPDNAQTQWGKAVQGLAHDENNWFIAETGEIWKVPVKEDLYYADDSTEGVIHVFRRDIPILADSLYDHWGDLDYYKYNGVGYLLVPLENNDRAAKPALAVFRSDNLDFVNYTLLPYQNDASWVAVDPSGDIYSDAPGDTGFLKYRIDWEKVYKNNQVVLQSLGNFSYLDESRNPITLEMMQGGSISPSGTLLYIVSGAYDHHAGNDGINVFDLQTGRRVQSSTDDGYFNYYFSSGSPLWQEPEGATIWDMDTFPQNERGGINGQLHVLLLENHKNAEDNIWINHYTNIIQIDGAYAGSEQKGTPTAPFKTIGGGNNMAWDGARLKIKGGSYPEKPTFNKHIQILADSSNVHIGGRILLSPTGAINLAKEGVLKII